MNRLKGIVYDGVLRAATIGFRKKRNIPRLLIVRVDEIGDFMLWHKFLDELIAAFPGHAVDFVGNQSWRSLFETFHAGAVSETYWLDKRRFKQDMKYRYTLLRQIYNNNYAAVINPTFSRDKRYDDSIVRAARAKENWGMVANLEAIRDYERGYDRNLYQHLFDNPARPLFEFFRNRQFTEFVTGSSSLIGNTGVERNQLPALGIDLPEKYFVVFPGSRSAARIWPAENFLLTAQHLYEQHGWTAVVCGTHADSAYTQAFCSNYQYPVLDLTGRTSLPQMLTLFNTAKCLLSVDTGSVHLAAAVNCPVFGIFNGSQYGRFAPYPAAVANNFFAIYPDELKPELADENLVRSKYEFVVKVPYALVKPEQVILALHEYFSKT